MIRNLLSRELSEKKKISIEYESVCLWVETKGGKGGKEMLGKGGMDSTYSARGQVLEILWDGSYGRHGCHQNGEEKLVFHDVDLMRIGDGGGDDAMWFDDLRFLRVFERLRGDCRNEIRANEEGEREQTTTIL